MLCDALICWNSLPTILLIISCYSVEQENRGLQTDIKRPERHQDLSSCVFCYEQGPHYHGKVYLFHSTEWANLQNEDKEKLVQFFSIWESVLVRAENPFPFAWDLWSGITQEAQRWELYVWPGRVRDRAAWGGCGPWIENCCWVCCDASLHPHKWIITWLPIFISKE